MSLTEIKNGFVGISCAHVDGSGNVDTKCYGQSDISDVANVQINLGDTTNGTQETHRTYMVYAFRGRA